MSDNAGSSLFTFIINMAKKKVAVLFVYCVKFLKVSQIKFFCNVFVNILIGFVAIQLCTLSLKVEQATLLSSL